MPAWNEILCAVDFSEPSRLAMLEACDIAKRNDGRLTLVNVYEPPAGAVASGDMIAPPSPKLLDMLAEDVARKLETWRIEAEKRVGSSVSAKVTPGEPAAEVVRLAKEGDFDLVVVATHGRHGVKRLLLGSVAERVVRDAPCSVLVARPAPPFRPD